MLGATIRRLVTAPDTWERHAVAARLLADVADVLDVGGTPGTLAGALPGRSVTTANLVPPADIVWDGGPLPFPARSFDGVASLDVLEHLPRNARAAHLDELVRVARRRVVVCCPLGSPGHTASERALAARRRMPFLLEQLDLGLPTEEELRELAERLGASRKLLFHGDYRRARRRALHPVAARLAPRRDLAVRQRPDATTNRAFLVVEL